MKKMNCFKVYSCIKVGYDMPIISTPLERGISCCAIFSTAVGPGRGGGQGGGSPVLTCWHKLKKKLLLKGLEFLLPLFRPSCGPIFAGPLKLEGAGLGPGDFDKNESKIFSFKSPFPFPSGYSKLPRVLICVWALITKQ